jgi:hypothetical protein
LVSSTTHSAVDALTSGWSSTKTLGGTEYRGPAPLNIPIALPDGRQLITLQQAADDIMELPKADHTAPEWQAAMEALNRGAERAFNSDRKESSGESGSGTNETDAQDRSPAPSPV